MTAEEALVALLHDLKGRNYQFITVTPSTHLRKISRPLLGRPSLRDIFGWSRPFRPDDLEPAILKLLDQSGSLIEDRGLLRSLLRVSSLGADLFLHSAFPTESPDAVFFGPDTYRFASFLKSEIPKTPRPPSSVVDLGAGTGAGAVVAAKLLPQARITILDINPAAIRLAKANCEAAVVEADFAICGIVPHDCDLVIANPPYMIDDAHRIYRDGGAILGGELALSWAGQALEALAANGTLLLYTGAAVLGDRIPLLEHIAALTQEMNATLETHEIDPDVFGEELDAPAYEEVDRIAVLGLKLERHEASPGKVSLLES